MAEIKLKKYDDRRPHGYWQRLYSRMAEGDYFVVDLRDDPQLASTIKYTFQVWSKENAGFKLQRIVQFFGNPDGSLVQFQKMSLSPSEVAYRERRKARAMEKLRKKDPQAFQSLLTKEKDRRTQKLLSAAAKAEKRKQQKERQRKKELKARVAAIKAARKKRLSQIT